MEEKESGYVTRTPEEDLLVVSMTPNPPIITLARYVIIFFMSVIILGIYLLMNQMFYPGYPVINSFAEKNESFAEHYPPFRMNEWICYSITDDIISGNLHDEESLSRKHSIGFSALAVPLTVKFGEIGFYYTNAFILWLSALVFFILMVQIVQFQHAIAFTFVFAFATPNLFFASSAYSEPTSQLLTLLSFFFLVKGLLSYKELFYYTLCGFTIGLNIFVQPFMILSVVIFAVIIFVERSRRSWKDMGVVFLFAGYSVSVIAFFITNKIVFGQFFQSIFSSYNFLYEHSYQYTDYTGGNIIVGSWKLLFDSPHGLIFIMPFTMIVPVGIIFMWREKLRSLSVIIGTLILFVILYAALNYYPITGESVGSRLLVPIIPFLVIPLAFVWEEEIGEKIWVGITLVLTIYMCSFGWWTGTVKEKGVFVGILHDRDARYILLARKDKLNKPAFISSGELTEIFFESLRKNDMKKWLQTLDHTTINEIEGFEREIFNDFSKKLESDGSEELKEYFIDFADPDNGVRLIIPEIHLNDSSEYIDIMP